MWQPGAEWLTAKRGICADMYVPANAQECVPAALAQPVEQQLAAEFTVGVHGNAYGARQEFGGGVQQLLLVAQRTGTLVWQDLPEQRHGATTKAQANDQHVLAVS